jgi:hypothetical protein
MSAIRLIPEKFSLLFRSILEMSRQIRTLRIWRAVRDKDENWQVTLPFSTLNHRRSPPPANYSF